MKTYPYVVISDGRYRLVATAFATFVLEQSVESKDATGYASRRWYALRTRIEDVDANSYNQCPPRLTLWLASALDAAE